MDPSASSPAEDRAELRQRLRARIRGKQQSRARDGVGVDDAAAAAASPAASAGAERLLWDVAGNDAAALRAVYDAVQRTARAPSVPPLRNDAPLRKRAVVRSEAQTRTLGVEQDESEDEEEGVPECARGEPAQGRPQHHVPGGT